MRISDWSSDVCSSDLPTTGPNAALGQSIAYAANLALLDSGNRRVRLTVYNTAGGAAAAAQRALAEGNRLFLGPLLAPEDRKSVVSGKSVSVRLDLGGPRITKKKHYTIIHNKLK